MQQIDHAYGIQSPVMPAVSASAVSRPRESISAQEAMVANHSQLKGSASAVSSEKTSQKKRPKKIIYEPPLEDKNLVQ